MTSSERKRASSAIRSFGEAVGQALLPLVAAEVVERQHRERGPVGQQWAAGPGGAAPLEPPPNAGGRGRDEEEQREGGRDGRAGPRRPAREKLASGRRAPVQHHAPGLDRLGDVLDPLRAHRGEGEIETPA
jgi:hypothetical protein